MESSGNYADKDQRHQGECIMGTFTISTGLGLLFTGIVVMAIIGFVGLHVINKIKDED